MTRTFLAAILLMAAMILPAAAGAVERGDNAFGLRAGYTSSNRSGIVGLYYQYAFSSRFRLAPDVDYSFRHRGSDALSLNLNGHFPLTAPAARYAVYPLAGLNYTSWNVHDHGLGGEDVSTRTDRLGLNIGAGAEYMATPSMRLGIEAKYRWIRNYSAAVITLSIGYCF